MTVLALLAACSPGGGKSVPVQPMPALPTPEPRGQTADQQVTHALNRLAFGGRPGDVAKVRATGAAPDPSPRMAQMVGQLGQPIYGHQAPNGWPETGDQWMNTGAILNRINFGMLIAAGRLPGASPLGFKVADVLQTATRELQVDGVITALLGGDASPETRAVLVSGENPLAAPAAGGSVPFPSSAACSSSSDSRLARLNFNGDK